MIETTRTRETKELQKVKILKENVTIVYIETVEIDHIQKDGEEEADDDNVVATRVYKKQHNEVQDFPPHIDFINAMKMLRKMVIDLCGFKDWENFDDYTVTGMTLTEMGSEETASVIINAQKKIGDPNQFAAIQTPTTRLLDPNYADSEKLDTFCAKVKQEAWAYLDGKHAENPQMSLNFEDGTNTKMPVK